MDWVKACVILPNCPAGNLPQNELEEQTKLLIANVSAKNQKSSNKKNKKQPIECLPRTVLNDKTVLLEWLEANVLAPSQHQNQHSGQSLELEYRKLLGFCLMRSVGVAMSLAVDQSEKEDKFGFAVALLTPEQHSLLSKSLSSNMPLLILGASGTGKSIVAEKKILWLANTDGQLEDDEKIVYVSHAKNNCFNRQMSAKLNLKGRGRIEFYAVKRLRKLLERIRERNKKGEKVQYVIIDQVEDFSKEIYEDSKLFKDIKESRDFKMLWLLVNPFDWPMEHRGDFLEEIRSPGAKEYVIPLTKRMRNSKAISVLLDRYETGMHLPGEYHPYSSGLAGPELFKATYDISSQLPNHTAQAQGPDSFFCADDQSQRLAGVVKTLMDDRGTFAQDILILPIGLDENGPPGKSFMDYMMRLDRALVAAFTSSQRREAIAFPSLAPFLTTAIELAKGVNCLHQESFMKDEGISPAPRVLLI
jgi:hypothetical protein